MKYFIDTEFIEDGKTIDLISIGIVGENRDEFYAELVDEEIPWERAHPWVLENVRPHLKKITSTKSSLKESILQFIGKDTPEFWGYYADYDWVVFCQIFGRMIDLPKGWPMYCRDIKQLADSMGNPRLPEQTSTEHNALNDARWNKEALEYLDKLITD